MNKAVPLPYAYFILITKVNKNRVTHLWLLVLVLASSTADGSPMLCTHSRLSVYIRDEGRWR